MKEIKAFSCIVERVVCPCSGRTRLKLTQASPVGAVRLWARKCLNALRRRRRAEDIPASDIVFSVDADKQTLVAMLQPWRKYTDETGDGAIRIAFMNENPPAVKAAAGLSF